MTKALSASERKDRIPVSEHMNTETTLFKGAEVKVDLEAKVLGKCGDNWPFMPIMTKTGIILCCAS